MRFRNQGSVWLRPNYVHAQIVGYLLSIEIRRIVRLLALTHQDFGRCHVLGTLTIFRWAAPVRVERPKTRVPRSQERIVIIAGIGAEIGIIQVKMVAQAPSKASAANAPESFNVGMGRTLLSVDPAILWRKLAEH